MSFCGTAEYLAPEMIDEKGHNKAVDYWALGVLIYEMIVGIPPFYNKDRNKMFAQIQAKSVKFPDKKLHGISVSEEAKSIINALLEKEPSKRLGMKEGADEILSHPFFKSIDTSALLTKSIQPSFVPKLSSDKYDVSHFDPEVTKQIATESVISDNTR